VYPLKCGWRWFDQACKPRETWTDQNTLPSSHRNMKPARQAFNDPQSKTKQRSRQESTYHYPIHVEWGIVGVVAEKSHSQEKQQGRNEPKEQYQNGVESVSCVVNNQWPVNSRHENKTTQQDTRQNWRTWRRKWRVHSERRLRAQQPAKYGCEHRCC